METLRLTQTVQKGGCAAKIAAVELRKILKQVRFPPTDDAVIIDGAQFDDAAIYKINDGLSLVQTLDFFTPIVDSPRLFGHIASANALSDAYAMGGTPKTALAILAFPLATLPIEVATEVLQGASDCLTEAHVSLVGGHSIDDDTLKFGLSVTGFVDPRRTWSNAGAHVGDQLILTKGLGTGTITAALKRQEVSESDIAPALTSMTRLNRTTDLLGATVAAGIHAATDITGFGLLGHAMQLALASQKTLAIEGAHVPRLSGAEDMLRRGFLTKAHRSNQAYVDARTIWGSLDDITRLLLVDPQTSGGLLLSVAPEVASEVLLLLRPRFPDVAVIGEVRAPSDHALELR